ncbi:hypothetical protein HanXRQr2_Chr08g0326551 [Helianthus annuus]|uniref:Uncharacterized protein n=1 Tax=Helianthus annuus TaxID=4232 RepID=A0A251U4H5_HELAN|nr:hypothetical protein HanXRQr2_Chr08g0326551 [Helianthus annuus]
MNPFTITTTEIYTIKASRVFHFSTSYTIKASIFYHSRVLCSSLLPISHLCIQNLRSSSIVTCQVISKRTLPTRFGKHRGFAFVEYVNQTRDEKRPSSSLYQTLIFMDTIRKW